MNCCATTPMRSSIFFRTPREWRFGTGPSRVFGHADAPPLGLVSRVRQRRSRTGQQRASGFAAPGSLNAAWGRTAAELPMKVSFSNGAYTSGRTPAVGPSETAGMRPDAETGFRSAADCAFHAARADMEAVISTVSVNEKAMHSGRRRYGGFLPVRPVTRYFGGSTGARGRLPESEAPRAGTLPRLRPFGALPKCPP